jgi:hypothetical protein
MSCSLKIVFNAIFVGLLVSLGACASSKTFDPNKDRKHYGVSVRQLPPQPVYNRLRLVYLPDPSPSSHDYQTSSLSIKPTFEYEMNDATLEQAARVLADMNRYSSYTSSIIANNKITLATVGTIDEIAGQLAKEADIKIVVDHDNKEVRFLAKSKESTKNPVKLEIPKNAEATSSEVKKSAKKIGTNKKSVAKKKVKEESVVCIPTKVNQEG